ncbi:hypothetical protein [Cerasicoccus frondis]|uniref:hypothetical protein n=1 Tax=Cerasicoccus frondis TaxID=490090 RepID=UPI0028529ACC|nr:hypothetical protein [Cerasicoccus frondis]
MRALPGMLLLMVGAAYMAFPTILVTGAAQLLFLGIAGLGLLPVGFLIGALLMMAGARALKTR